MIKKNNFNGFSKIDKVIKFSAKQHNLEGALHRHQLIKHWEEVAGGFVVKAKELSKAIDFKKGVLTVACLTSEVAYQIKLMSEKIISALNEILGRQVVFAIYIEK